MLLQRILSLCSVLAALFLASGCTSFEICDAVVDAEDDKYVCVNQGVL